MTDNVQSLKPIASEPDRRVIAVLEEALEEAREGRINGIILVAEGRAPDREPCYYSNWAFDQTWKIFAALEYGRGKVIRNMDP